MSLRASEASRLEATRRGDEALADFIDELPEQLRKSLSEADIWQSTLDLTYNNFLILLHRFPPRSEGHLHKPEMANDSSICGDATAVLTSTLDTLRVRQDLSKLWWCGSHALFTAIIHVSGELESTNPLVVAKSSRIFESLLVSLRDLSGQWLYAKSLLRLFEERASRGIQRKRSAPDDVNAPSQPRVIEEAHGESPGFSLRPQSFEHSTAYFGHSTGEATSLSLQPSPVTSSVGHNRGSHVGQGSYQPSQANSIIYMHQGHQARPNGQSNHMDAGEPGRGQLYSSELFGGDVGMFSSNGDMLLNGLPFPEASALEYLLAGMNENENEYGYG